MLLFLSEQKKHMLHLYLFICVFVYVYYFHYYLSKLYFNFNSSEKRWKKKLFIIIIQYVYIFLFFVHICIQTPYYENDPLLLLHMYSIYLYCEFCWKCSWSKWHLFIRFIQEFIQNKLLNSSRFQVKWKVLLNVHSH